MTKTSGKTSWQEVTQLSDEQLCLLFQGVSEHDSPQQTSQVLAILIKRYQEKLAHYLGFLVQNHDLIEDIIQATFIKVYLNINKFDPKQKFSSWVYRIAHNEAVDMLRKNKHLLSPLEAGQVLERMPSKLGDLESELEAKEQKQGLWRAVNQLELKYREPLVLAYFQDKSYEEIAEILHLNKNLVGVRIRRAKEKLRADLESEHEKN